MSQPPPVATVSDGTKILIIIVVCVVFLVAVIIYFVFFAPEIAPAPAEVPAPRRLRREILNRLPKQTYEEGESGSECAICIEEYEEGDEVRVLPCNHVFHVTCVDTWFADQSSCPTCRHIIDLPVD